MEKTTCKVTVVLERAGGCPFLSEYSECAIQPRIPFCDDADPDEEFDLYCCSPAPEWCPLRETDILVTMKGDVRETDS